MNASSADFSSDDDAIETAAAEWLIAREEGFAPGRAAEFAAWRAADPRHEEAALRTERALDLIREMPALRSPLEVRSAQETAIIRLASFRSSIWASGLAATLAFMAVLWWFVPSRVAATQHYATAATRQQQIALRDGSVVNLNVSTDVQVALTPAARRVTLTAGEAHFAVAHDAARPFIVTAAGVSVRAIGTAFSVRLGDQGVEVLVTEGKVEIAEAEPLDPSTPPAAANVATPRSAPSTNGSPTRLVASERTVIARAASAAPAIERVSADALQTAVRWHSPVMTFSDLPLRDAVSLFNRRNATQLILADAKLGDCKIGGTFAADQVEAFVRLLVQGGEVTFERNSASEIVLRRAP